MLDLLTSGFFSIARVKKKHFFLQFGVDYFSIDMVLFNNGIVTKILFLQPSNYIIYNNRISRKKQDCIKKKSIFFDIVLEALLS